MNEYLEMMKQVPHEDLAAYTIGLLMESLEPEDRSALARVVDSHDILAAYKSASGWHKFFHE